MTGVEHMNFATSQTFGPVQYLLVYETLAKRFAHDVVLVGFLLENDFTDSNWEIGQIVQAAEPLTKGVRSFYYDYDQADQAITRYTLNRLMRAADGRPVVIVTIPMLRDLLNLKDRGRPPLPTWFGQMGRELGFTYVDLLPVLAVNAGDWSGYYHECDHHWTSKANALVAKALAPVMEEAVASAKARHAKTSQ
jgi:hypothetical protein